MLDKTVITNSNFELKYLKPFIIYNLISVIAGCLIGGVQGAILGAILGMFGVDVETIVTVTTITGAICGTIVSFFVFRWTIKTQIIPQLIKSIENDSSQSI